MKVSRDIDSAFLNLRYFSLSLSLSLPKQTVDPQVHLTFLTSLLSRIDADKSKDAHVLLLATIARAKLLYGDLEGTRGEMEKAWGVLDALDDVEPGVNAAYYGLAADYYKASMHIH